MPDTFEVLFPMLDVSPVPNLGPFAPLPRDLVFPANPFDPVDAAVRETMMPWPSHGTDSHG